MPQPRFTPCVSLPAVEVRNSEIHGLGVFAAKTLPKGSTLGFYDGRRYTARQIARITWDEKLTYLFGLSDGTTIDGGNGGNATRHLNHACAPNCEAQEETGEDGKLRVRIATLKRVRPGEELFIDYALTADESASPADYACRCGARKCRGTMLGAV
ncbi:SET domain-containing protein-lysine N-methyltransferase [Xylophilus rhododendri]|uniref:SET domain-containing protein-lysine N-methyltransferase n=1 Tax=Xylophilus rhododendri TaxID=2697032 RepID=A0A857J9Q0_9BURK|nr:SET domain-containing protein [Xylophilus rhododendri]QHJ00751.1 SET domain-containing protein-lysine N-methyltransferase [Xylophilus rhododendri]